MPYAYPVCRYMVVHTHIHIHMLDRRVDDLGMSSLVGAKSVVASIAQSVRAWA